MTGVRFYKVGGQSAKQKIGLVCPFEVIQSVHIMSLNQKACLFHYTNFDPCKVSS